MKAPPCSGCICAAMCAQKEPLDILDCEIVDKYLDHCDMTTDEFNVFINDTMEMKIFSTEYNIKI